MNRAITRNVRIYTENKIFTGETLIRSNETDDDYVKSLYNQNIVRIMGDDGITVYIKSSHISVIEILPDISNDTQ